MAALHEALPKAMRGGHTAESRSLLPLVAAALRPGDLVLVKGSLGSRMGPLVAALADIESQPPLAAIDIQLPRAANGE